MRTGRNRSTMAKPYPSRVWNKIRMRKPDFWETIMGNGWTAERRARQAAMIHRWQPWQSSTGLRTARGKAKASRNGWKGGTRPVLRELARAFREQREALAEFAE
ncbi:MAG: hypothetical protein ABI132_10000 [Rhodanobacteraceae bacterium]